MTRKIALPHTGSPQVQLMGNHEFALMVASDGSSRGCWQGLATNRWHAHRGTQDSCNDILIRDLDTGVFWSAMAQAHGLEPVDASVYFEPGHARFERRDSELESAMNIHVHESSEIRVLTLSNHGSRSRHLEVASVMELVLGSAQADDSHPAFSKMFVQTEVSDDQRTLLARRRPNSSDEQAMWSAHACHVHAGKVTASGFATDRARLLGRCRSLRDPALFDPKTQLAGSAGTVLDPLFCLRRQFELPAGTKLQLSFTTAFGRQRQDVLKAAEPAAQSEPPQSLQAALRSAHSQQAGLGINGEQELHMQTIAAPLLYADAMWRAPSDQLTRAHGGQPSLWPHGISGDRPIVLLNLQPQDPLELAQQLLIAQHAWQQWQLSVDLVFVHSAKVSDALSEMVQQGGPDKDAGAGVFMLDKEKLTQTDQDALACAASVVLDSKQGDVAAQIAARESETLRVRASLPPVVSDKDKPPVGEARKLDFDNGYGGFSKDGHEYVIVLKDGRCTPAPWINVLANPEFGCLVSAEGGGYTWSVNSQQNQITPWRNDAVVDLPGEVIYLRDLESGALWTVTAQPIRGNNPYTITHGHGYTRYQHCAHGIYAELTVFVSRDEPVKLSRLRLRNVSGRKRRLSVSAYVEWALGAIGRDSARTIVSQHDDKTGALFARNRWRTPFTEKVAFLDFGGRQQTWTCDRAAFLGSRGDMACPAELIDDAELSQRAGAGLDPCAVLQSEIQLPSEGQSTLLITLGEANDEDHARALIGKFRDADPDALLEQSQQQWRDILDVVQVKTPDQRIDRLVNGWLLYQTLACRVWARTAFYQSSGAWGFRDQLQDVMALCLSRPDVAREHILRAANRQFPQGDVQHWWLPPEGAGVRTRIVDDRLWLPYVTAHYVKVTGDQAILDEDIPFLDGEPLKPDELERFFTPAVSDQHASLFEHCARAIEVSLETGTHGLPLFGTGDWNDGMNRVGKDGKGESVWMAWFLCSTLNAMLPFARQRQDNTRAESWTKHTQSLLTAAKEHAWDGQWWLRGWYDNGHTLGSSNNQECRIDTIAQSWSVLCGGLDRERTRSAMAAVDRLAVEDQARLIRLFTPALDTTDQDPGYIKGYPPGLRENGGQYTHGVIWSAIAFAELGNGDRAGELLDMLNPISHADTAKGIDRYKVEPYVSCADVYSAPGQVGRGGWTWYSGSAGWLYRALLEWQLGLRLEGDQLRLEPCIPSHWPGYEIRLHYRSASYLIKVDNPDNVCRGLAAVAIDGIEQTDAQAAISLDDDQEQHVIAVRLGTP